MKRQGFLLSLALSISLLLAWTGPPRSRRSVPPTSSPIAPTAPARANLQSSGQPLILHASVDPILLKQALEEANTPLRFVVEMFEQSDRWHQTAGQTRTEQRTALVRTLQTTAEASQVDIVAELDSRMARGQVERYRSFWIFNGLAVTANADTLLALAARPDVRAIHQDRWRGWLEEPEKSKNPPQVDGTGIEWNIGRIRADMTWSALRLDGSGVTVAIIDTGVDWQHPALHTQYRGYKPEGLAVHQGNWFCTTDEGALYPVDGSGHGTHVAGTVVGYHETTGQAVGVAPGARWIAVKTLNDQGYAYDSWIHAAFEWILAPGGDPRLAPDVANGSWGSWDDEDETFRPDLQALRASGIVPVFAAGNEGPRTSSLRSPASYPEAIAVGATDDLDQVTSFSSRGPSPWGEDKPEVVAPGAQIRSSLPGGTYGVRDGTSMAAPHVTGLVALMFQAAPNLSVNDIEAILTSTTLPLADQIPNNESGWGRVDAYRAAATAMEAGTITGQVRRLPDLQPLPTAQIGVEDDLGDPWATVQADQMGRYWVALPAGRYSLTAHAFGYEPQTMTGVTVQAALTTSLDLELSPVPSGVLWGQITNMETSGPVGAEIAVVNTPAHTASDPQTGQYSIVLPAGTYSLEVSQNGYRRATKDGIEIVADRDTQLDVALSPAPTLLLVDSGQWYYDSQASYFQEAMDDRDYVYDLWEIRDPGADLPGLDDLTRYQVTIWSSPQDAPGLIGAGDIISNYLTAGGNLMLSGQDVGFWDDGLSGLFWHPYYGRLLKAKAVADDAGRADVVGRPGEIFTGLSLPMNGPDSAGNQISPDAITLRDTREAAIIANYEDGGKAALRANGCQSYRSVYFAAGLEGLGDLASRAEVMDRTLAWLGGPHPAVDAGLNPGHQDGVWLAAQSVTYTVELQNTGGFTDQFSLELSPSAWPATIWDATFSQVLTRSNALAPCQMQMLGLEVTVPPDVAWNVTDVVTLTARSLSDLDRTARAAFHSKAPAPILLVDDDRWYDTQDHYVAALEANSVSYDLWEINFTQQPDLYSPSLQRLQRYPIAIWFTGYDWYRTLTALDEERLATYLDAGGRLLLSSQDYLYTSGFTDFAREYLGVASFTEGLTVTQVTEALSSPIGDGLGRYDLVYPFRNWSDALRPSPEAQMALWGQHAQPAALTVEQLPWKTAFFAFPLESLHEEDMATVVGRTVDWLSPLGDSSLSVDHPVAAQGDELAYTLIIRNTGPRLLSNVSLSNTVPASTTYVDSSLQGPALYDPLTNRFTWNGPLDSSQIITVRYRLRLDAALPGGAVIPNVAHLSDESGLSIDRLSTIRVNTPDLSSSGKIVSLQEATPGQTLTYTLALRNDGLRPSQAHLIDPIPLHTTYEPGSASASSGQLTATEGILHWTGSISAGLVVTITFPVMISPSTAGLLILNRAILEDGWGDVQPLEAHSWVKAGIFLPLVLKQP